MQQPADFISIVLYYDSESSDAKLHLSAREPMRSLTPRERADRLYEMGEFAAAAALLLPSSVN